MHNRKYGAVDGIAGTFCIDTVDSASGLLLIAPFVRRYCLVERYAATIPYGGSAVGGETYGLFARARHLTLSGRDGRPAVSVADPITRLSQQKGGFDANAYVSGNIGMEILRQFNVTFDYYRQQIIFEKNRRYGAREIFSLAGWRLHKEGKQWSVAAVFPGGSAARAGIRKGDILLALNGKNVSQWEGASLRELFIRSKIGDKVTVRVRSGETQRTVILTLRDAL